MTEPTIQGGNYAVDTLLHVIQSQGNLDFTRWDGKQPVASNTLLVGSGEHWQAVLKEKDGNWFIFERLQKYPVHNLQAYLNNKLKHGAVYQFAVRPSTMANFSAAGIRKKALEGTISTEPNKRQKLYWGQGTSLNFVPPAPKKHLAPPKVPTKPSHLKF